MLRELRWRIITLQAVMVVLFAFGAGLAFWGSNFTNDQIKGQLEPQMISFPKDASKLPADLQKYAGQQVLNGEQAHAYGDGYIGLHLRELADGKVYSQLSTEARTEKDPIEKAKKDGLVQTAFRGETLRAILNQAWAFSIFGTIALYAGIGLALATLIVLGSLLYEVVFAKKPAAETAPALSLTPTRT